MSDDDVKLNFRFEKRYIHRLVQALRVPNEIRTQERHVVSSRYYRFY
nr:unnamed protein product [Callosobruchus analis]